jgi:GNAT superfamily N-acetyltransferase
MSISPDDIYDPDDTESGNPNLPQFTAEDFRDLPDADDPVTEPTAPVPAGALEIVKRAGDTLVNEIRKRPRGADPLSAETVERVFSKPTKKTTQQGKSGHPEITNYFDKKAKKAGEQDQPPPSRESWKFQTDQVLLKAVANGKITVTGDDGGIEYSAKISPFPADDESGENETGEKGDEGPFDPGVEIGELILFHDKEGFWVNNVEVHARYRKRGIATKLIKAACLEHGTILFSTQRWKVSLAKGDTRYMSDDGAALARKLAASADPDIKVQVKMPGGAQPVPKPEKEKPEKEKEKPEKPTAEDNSDHDDLTDMGDEWNQDDVGGNRDDDSSE